ncbi:hypothetical protein TRFO_04717 [Tritrichomonas foetus]|uniref:Uncharacterized protein n=1 Tax=Tritrichomonas foetus TaxID=1144522 RepID=A0A1J4KIH8_9EUKA|nr:hypothetical protein TRFO_04717 [Tritrichomonas foetus]|eukprot:OHT09109.1 hypothetical protein TRFO_04717 [Tritrichomonas foetus]
MFIAYQPQLTDLFPYSMSVTEFLKTYVSFNSHPIFSTHFSNYVKNHITELLELTFSNCDDEYSKKAFIVLSTGDGLIARSLIDKYFFFSKSTEIFASCDRFSNSDKSPNNKTNIMKISRLASIFQNILMKSSNIDYEAVGFLAQILSYIDNSVVFDLLKTVCSNSNHKSIQFEILFLQIPFNFFVKLKKCEKVVTLLIIS